MNLFTYDYLFIRAIYSEFAGAALVDVWRIMIPVLWFQNSLELARRRNVADDAETPSSVFLPVDVFVVFPLTRRGGRTE